MGWGGLKGDLGKRFQGYAALSALPAWEEERELEIRVLGTLNITSEIISQQKNLLFKRGRDSGLQQYRRELIIGSN